MVTGVTPRTRATLDKLEGEGRVVFRYVGGPGDADEWWSPNGSMRAIAGIVNEAGNVLGMMPHPERAIDPLLGSADGLGVFESMLARVAVIRNFEYAFAHHRQLPSSRPRSRIRRAESATIDPGMTRDQVVAKLGEPLSSRSYDGFTYLLYRNGCEKKCGMNDLVVLDSGKVVDAVFRSSGRTYSGTSSSPQMISRRGARPATATPRRSTLRQTAPASNAADPKKPSPDAT